MSRRLQRVALQHTRDLDITNVVFVILDQLITRMQLRDVSCIQPELDLLRRLATDRDYIIASELNLDKSTGKKLLHSIIGGKRVPLLMLETRS